MSNIHIKTVLSHIRFFSDDENASYENRTPYKGIATVQFINDDEAFISALHGTITRKDFRAVLEELASMGITVVRYERHGKEKIINI